MELISPDDIRDPEVSDFHPDIIRQINEQIQSKWDGERACLSIEKKYETKDGRKLLSSFSITKILFLYKQEGWDIEQIAGKSSIRYIFKRAK